MRLPKFALVLLPAFLVWLPAYGSEESAATEKCIVSNKLAKLKVTLQLYKQNIEHGELIKLAIHILNIGETVVTIPAVMRPEDYWLKFVIRNHDGQTVKFTGTEVKLRGAGDSTKLFPGYFWGTEITDLSSYYKLGVPGKYSIQAIYGVSPLGDCPNGRYESEVISIQIEDARNL